MADMGSWRKIQIQVTEFQLPKWGGTRIHISIVGGNGVDMRIYPSFLAKIQNP
jgi:hypothetical protein